MDKQVKHIVALSDYLEASLYPVKFCQLEELSLCKCLQKRSFILRFGWTVMQLVQHPHF